MIKKTKNNILWFEFEFLSKQSEILHFQSTRVGGQSLVPFDALNLGFGTDDEADVLTNRQKFAQTLGFAPENVVAQNQIHDINVQIVDKSDAGSGFYSKNEAISDCDAMITNEYGICLWVFGADCLPLLFYDAENKVIAVAHAGWKGTLANIAAKTIEMMQENFSSQPTDIHVAMGAGISVKYYKIGEEVVSKVFAQFGIDEPFMVQNPKTGRFHFDLINTNLFLLYQAGINPDNIEISDLCTYEHSEWFYSARRDKTSGRQVAGIMLKE